jgi:hypothetical protein
VGDPRWRGVKGEKLKISVASAEANDLVVVLTENFFRGYRGKSRELAAVVRLPGGGKPAEIVLQASDFKDPAGEVAKDWANADILGFRAYVEKDGKLLGSKAWKGSQPVFSRLEWVP